MGRSKNALAQRLGNESLAALGRRMSKNLLHGFTDKMAKVAPKTALAMWESEAQDNKGCCSANKGTLSWQMIEEVDGWSYPGLYNGDKNLNLLAARLSRACAPLVHRGQGSHAAEALARTPPR